MSETSDRESKTEEATEKRLNEAIEKGQLPYSREVPTLLGVAAIWLGVMFLLADACLSIALALRTFWEAPTEWRLVSAPDGASVLAYIAGTALLPLLPFLGLVGAAGLVGSLVQTRGFSMQRIKPQASRISPFAGWQRLFGRDGLGHTLKSTVGLVLVGAAVGVILPSLLRQSMALFGVDAGGLAGALLTLTGRLLLVMMLAMLLVTVVEVALGRKVWRRNLRMSKQEVKDESKEADGNPEVKLRMRMTARRRLRRRMLAAVPSATVVITNPTHYAVALRYVAGETAAPIVVAKGADFIALKIREVALAARVPVVEDQQLARALYAGAEIDAAIPAELYRAVARIILFVDHTAANAKGRL